MKKSLDTWVGVLVRFNKHKSARGSLGKHDKWLPQNFNVDWPGNWVKQSSVFVVIGEVTKTAKHKFADNVVLVTNGSVYGWTSRSNMTPYKK